MIDLDDVTMTERAVLYSALQKDSVRMEILADVTADWFSDLTHRTLFKAIARMHENGVPFDALSIHRAARENVKANLGEVVLEPDWLHRAMLENVGGITIEALKGTHLPILREAYLSRSIQSLALRFMDVAQSASPASAMAWMSQELDAISDRQNERVQILTDTQIMAKLLDESEDDDSSGPLTTLPSLDALEFRITPGQLISIVGRPGECKSTIVRHMALGVASQVTTAIFVLEDGHDGWLRSRTPMVSGGATSDQFRENRVRPEHYEKYSEFLSSSVGRNLLVIDGKDGMSVFDIIAHMRRLKHAHPDLGAVFIDQTYDIEGYYDLKKGEHMTTNVTRIVKQLRRAAKQLNVGLVMLQHVNRDNGEPTKDNISDSDVFAKVSRKILICSRKLDGNGVPHGALTVNVAKYTYSKQRKLIMSFDDTTQCLDGWVDPCLAA